MAIAVAIVTLIIALALAYKLSVGESPKRKYIVWGTATMLAIAPLFSWLVSISYAMLEGSGWAGVALIAIMFPVLFIAGLVILLIGIFSKKN